MIGITHDHTGLVTGITLNQTTYSPEALELLITRLERAEAERERLRGLIYRYNQAEYGSDEELSALLDIEAEGTGEL